MLNSRHRFLGAVLVMGAALMGCDPCRSLAEKICECEETSAQRDVCRRSLDLFGNMQSYSAAAKTQMCSEVLKRESCTCPALQAGQVENCGMTR